MSIGQPPRSKRRTDRLDTFLPSLPCLSLHSHKHYWRRAAMYRFVVVAAVVLTVMALGVYAQSTRTANPAGRASYSAEQAQRGKALYSCLLYTSPSPRDRQKSRMPSSA